jgi:glycosyltransferase involved in cell wall biosynthesis
MGVRCTSAVILFTDDDNWAVAPVVRVGRRYSGHDRDAAASRSVLGFPSRAAGRLSLNVTRANRRRPERRTLMRVAWQGPLGAEEGGVAYAGLQLVHGLRASGVKIDCYSTVPADEVPSALREDDGIRFVCRPPRWKWDRWYSRTPMRAFITRQAARGLAQRRLMQLIAEEHARRPYDLLYQFSNIELFGVRRLQGALPPIVVHPEVHAAGELAWHRREDTLAARGETRPRRLAARAILAARAARQRRDIRLARRVIAPSHVFAAHLASDYGISLDRISVVPNPIDLERFAPVPSMSSNGRTKPLTVLFVSRLSTRKGVDLVVGVSHRLADLAGEVSIDIIGDRSLWSDYRPLLADLHPEIGSYVGPLEPAALAERYLRAGLLIQPSWYEPFALTVGEALASGVPVVASSEVGAVEDVDHGCCTVFTAGDLDAFEAAVRALVDRIRGGEGEAISRLARTEAQRLFSVHRVAGDVVEALELAALAGRAR